MLPLSTLSLRLTKPEAFTLEQASRAYELPPLSTYWMPLDEPRHAWAAFGEVATLAPMLNATAHAFFALASETKALRHFSLAVEQERRRLFAAHAGYWYGQSEQALGEAARHWSRAAYELDVLAASDFRCPQDGLDEARSMSRAARVQQERLWKLTDEVRAAIVLWRERHPPQQQQEEASR